MLIVAAVYSLPLSGIRRIRMLNQVLQMTAIAATEFRR